MSKEAGSAVYNINMLYRIMEEHWKLTRSNNNCCTFHLWPNLKNGPHRASIKYLLYMCMFFALLTDSDLSAMLGGDVKQLNMEHGKSDSSHKGANNKDSQRQPQATELKEDSEENVTGSKGPKLAKTTRKEIATNKMTNINNNVQGLGTEKLATNLLTRFRGQSSSMLKNNNNKVPMETKWAAALPVKEPMQNQNVFNAHNAIGPNVNGKVSGKYCVIYDKHRGI